MKILITILILFFPILGEFIAKLITQEWDDITDFLLTIPPFNIISAMKKYYGKENIIINYNSILLQVGGLFIITIIGTIGLIYMYLNDDNLFTFDNINIMNDDYNNNNENKTMTGGGYTKINKSFFNKFYI